MFEQHESCEKQGCCPAHGQPPIHEYTHKVCGQCPCGCGSQHPCHMYLWHMSFFVAKKEVMVDILKSKIQEALGPKMEQTADIILQAMEARKKGEHDMKSKLHELWEKSG